MALYLRTEELPEFQRHTSVIDVAVQFHDYRPAVDGLDELGEGFLAVCGHVDFVGLPSLKL